VEVGSLYLCSEAVSKFFPVLNGVCLFTLIIITLSFCPPAPQWVMYVWCVLQNIVGIWEAGVIVFVGTERTENDRVAEPIDSAVSSPGAYLALGLLYTIAALPAIVAPQIVSPAMHPDSDLLSVEGSCVLAACMHACDDALHCMPVLGVYRLFSAVLVMLPCRHAWRPP